MVSFDVKSLFTNVPIKECLKIVEEKLASDNTLEERTAMTPQTIISLLNLCMSSNYFGFEESIYEQVDGTPMGSPLSPVLADLYMEFFEEKAIEEHHNKPELWVRYVDDTFVIWKHGKAELHNFLSHLNNFRDSIKFAMEIEESGSLSFLDVLVTKNGNEVLTSIHRKKTHTNRYLHFLSNHHPSIKTGIIKCLAHRGRTICSKDNINMEINLLKKVFESNGYPTSLVNRCLMHSLPNKKQNLTNQEKNILVLPYIKGLSERINTLCRKLNVQLVSTSKLTIRSLLVQVKNKVKYDQKNGVVYKVDCECGQTYIGETGRSMEVRMKEHRRAVLQDNKNNGIAVHANNTMHDIQWSSAEVLHSESHWYKRKVLESLYINDKHSSDKMNLDNGLKLNSTWVTLAPNK